MDSPELCGVDLARGLVHGAEHARHAAVGAREEALEVPAECQWRVRERRRWRGIGCASLAMVQTKVVGRHREGGEGGKGGGRTRRDV